MVEGQRDGSVWVEWWRVCVKRMWKRFCIKKKISGRIDQENDKDNADPLFFSFVSNCDAHAAHHLRSRRASAACPDAGVQRCEKNAAARKFRPRRPSPSTNPFPFPFSPAPPDATLADALAAVTTAAARHRPTGAAAGHALALTRGGAPCDASTRCASLPPGADVFVVGSEESDHETGTTPTPAPTNGDATAIARSAALAAAGDRAAGARLLAATPGPDAAAARVGLLLDAGRLKEARAAADAACAAFPSSYPALLARARALAAATPPDADRAAVFEAYDAAVGAAPPGDAALDARAGAALAAHASSDPSLSDAVAVELAQVVLEASQDTHVDALAVYASVAARRLRNVAPEAVMTSR